MPKKNSFVLDVVNAQKDLSVDTKRIKKLCRKILDDHAVTSGHLGIVFVDGETMHRTNREFLQHDYPTDVISFPFDVRLEEGFLEGEIWVCPRVAQERAAEFGLTSEAETLLYAVHGTLHLVGYDDQTPSERKKMRKMEQFYREKQQD